MRHSTLLELADGHGVRLPEGLREGWPELVRHGLDATDERGWFRFQRLYDAARAVLRDEADVRRLVSEAAQDECRWRARAGWRSRSIPSGYAALFGGVTAFTDLVLDAVREASAATGIGMAVVIAANRTRHPLDARTLARLAAQYAGRGVVGFRAVQRRAARGDGGVRAGVRDRPPCRAAQRPARRRAARGAARCGPAWTSWAPTGWGTACEPWRTRRCLSGSRRPGRRWRCARRPTWRSGCGYATRGRAAARPAGGGGGGGVGGR